MQRVRRRVRRGRRARRRMARPGVHASTFDRRRTGRLQSDLTSPGSPRRVEAPQLENDRETVESLRRRLDEYERLVRLLDAQVHVLERERQKLAAVVGHGDVGFLVVDASLQIVWTNEFFARHLKGP